MRTAFINELVRRAKADPSIFLLVGDLGFGVIESFAQQCPDQFANAGIAEQNMTGMAAGLALNGYTVCTYSIANFTTLRCFEQIRNDVCYHDANVKIVSVGGGYAYGALSSTHHATEDLAVLRALPCMTVVAPADPVEARLATSALLDFPHPCYLRLNRAGDTVLHEHEPFFALGKAIEMRSGSDVTLIATGAIMTVVLEAAVRLALKGVSARVVSMHTVKPVDGDTLARAARETRAVISVEEHSIIGGLGSAILEWYAQNGSVPRFKSIGIPDGFSPVYGSQEYLREKAGLTADNIEQEAYRMAQSVRPYIMNTIV